MTATQPPVPPHPEIERDHVPWWLAITIVATWLVIGGGLIALAVFQ